MRVEPITADEVDQLSALQPADWSDIRPYFYYYIGAAHCDPVKITENGEILAVGTTIRHQDSSWLAHIIVHPDQRGKGLGKTIAAGLLERVPAIQRRTIYLDATDMGFPVYQKLGFQTETEYLHLSGKPTNLSLDTGCGVQISPFTTVNQSEILALDKKISCEDRIDVLRDHLPFSLVAMENGLLSGVYFPTLFDGYIGAFTEQSGQELMKIRMRSKFSSRLPAESTKAINFLTQNGYSQTGLSRRMVLGEKRGWKADHVFNRISGGLG